MSDGNFAEYIRRKRDRLNAEWQAIITQQRELDQRLAEINREFQAVDASEAAKSGKRPTQQAGARKPSGVRHARRGSRGAEFMSDIRQGHGLTRSEILGKMGLKGNKSAEMSVSNALTALTKSRQVRRNEERKYVAA